MGTRNETTDDYPERWQTKASYIVKDDARPHRVHWLQNGAGLYMTSWSEEVISFLSFDPTESGADLSFNKSYVLGGRPGGVGSTPLVGLVSPRPPVALRESD